MTNNSVVHRPATTSRQTTRPPEPLRPRTGVRAGTGLLAAKARRRRFQQPLPPHAEDWGW